MQRKQTIGGGRAEDTSAEKGQPVIPDKLYFRIGEAARLLSLQPYVLRFWETEFPQLRPNKGGTGQRLYRKRDVEMALRIKRLLYEEGYTITGARQLLKAELRDRGSHEETPATTTADVAADQAGPDAAVYRLRKLRSELQDLARILGEPPAGTPNRFRVPSRSSRGLHLAPQRDVKRDGTPSLFPGDDQEGPA